MPRSIWTLIALAALLQVSAAEDEPLGARAERDQLILTRESRPVARYVFRDEKIQRPYFTAVHSPSGDELTRRHPPRAGIDASDHADMHPGIWLAFGDLGGADFWRNKGRVVHAGFVEQPRAVDDTLTFAVKNEYRDGERPVCQEEARYQWRMHEEGYLLLWESTFSGPAAFAFGDQEEMGLGVRLATPLCVKGGTGTITTSSGKQNEREAWGTTADWCDYSGASGDRRVGVLLMPHPDNFRPSWLHVRDYGLLVANPFGQRAFTKGPASRIEIKPGEKLRLRFGIWIYSTPKARSPDYGAVYEEFRRLAVE